MRIFATTIIWISVVVLSTTLAAQNFSNKGKDFWVAYGYHARMVSTDVQSPDDTLNAQNMVLYFSSDKNANVTVNIPGISYTRNYFVAANTVTISDTMPKAGSQDIRLHAASTAGENKGIHITSDVPIVAYAHIYHSTSSGVTLLYPTPTLSKEYYSINFTNRVGSLFAGTGDGNANSFFYVIATDPGTTTVEITPSAPAIGHPAGQPFTVSLTQGQVYNVMGEFSNIPNGNYMEGSDLTGSTIKSISSGSNQCKKIAVFSGSGNIIIVCNNDGQIASRDNYMVQALPKNAWGKKYLTVPSIGYEVSHGNTNSRLHHNWYRICVSDPSTVVRVNGNVTTLPLVNNFYYEIKSSNEPLSIEADKPVTVAQYFPSRVARCYLPEDNQGDGDPEVIYLSPVDQGINHVVWTALSRRFIKPELQYIHVIIPSSGSAISSFKLDGNPVAASSFKPHPNAPGYSYAILNVSSVWSPIGPGITHQVYSDSNFNAIAYGYGAAESYGFNAGTNIKDRFQFMTVHNVYAQVQSPATCKDAPFRLSVTLPYQPVQIKWLFGGLFNDETILTPVFDSTWITEGRTLYRYTLPTIYRLTTPGNYTIKIVALNPTPGQCTNEQELEFDLPVLEKPVSNFNYTSSCFTNPTVFLDNSATGGRSVTSWYWDFDDGNISLVHDPSHIFPAAGTYDVRYGIITDIGCPSDTISKPVTIGAAPLADFNTQPVSFCPGNQISFSDASMAPPGDNLVKWTWNFGDGSPDVIASSNMTQTHVYPGSGTFTITLLVETNSCKSLVKSKTVTINKPPLAGFILPKACISDTGASFTDTSSVESGSIISWQWDFGDPNSNPGNPNTSALQNPAHHFSVAGPYTVRLIVTSSQGCKDTVENVLFVNGDILDPAFEVQNSTQLCSNKIVSIRNTSSVNTGSIIKVIIFWDASDPATIEIDDNPWQGKIYQHNYPAFNSPSTRTYTIRYEVYSGTNCKAFSSKTITLLSNPLIQFSTIPPACFDAAPFQLTQAIELTGMAGTGTYSGPGISSPDIFSPASAGEGLHTIYYTFTGINGCSDEKENTILVYPVIPVNAGPDKQVLQGNGVVLTPESNFTQQVRYLWSPPLHINDITMLNPTVSPPDDITYTLTVIFSNDCKSSDQVFVKVLKPLSIPNVFSPNGDGVHDLWEIKNIEPYPGSLILIYNRYGQLIHKIQNYTAPWDGRVNGKNAPVGTYYYIIYPKNGIQPISGYVDLIR